MQRDNNYRPVKRARVEQSNMSPSTTNHWLFTYQFLLPLVVKFLSDSDVLTRLLLVGKKVKPFLLRYLLKGCVTHENARVYRSMTRYSPVTIIRMTEVTDPDLASFRGLQEVDMCHDLPIEPSMLPDSLKHICFMHDWNHPLHPGVLPASLKSLVFENEFNQPIRVGCLPEGLQTLEICGEEYTRRLLVGVLPYSITSLSLPQRYNHSFLPGVLPAGLTRFDLPPSYNRPLQPGSIPQNITTLDLRCDFNHPIEAGVIPAHVTDLTLSSRFNQPLLPGQLPVGLQRLDLGGEFNHPLTPGVIPETVTELALSDEFN